MSMPLLPPTDWHKSSYSGTNTNCVECARTPNAIAVRDSRHPHKGRLDIPAVEWTAFLDAVKHTRL
ncbi:DUF397 domain-containing protein [Nocardiopsis potens]|uniref:DUF397 domain-containing protein n=1 Tax=Nocardiopsis potens TaxID=1246458 RepID=UPI00036D3C2D|nr:DUF397 domain-containing protein [Nocardiopsis potens]